MSYCLFPWSNFHGPISKKYILKALGSLTRVNQARTKKSDHAPKSGCVDFFEMFCSKRLILGFCFSCLTFSYALLFIEVTFGIKKIKHIFLCHGSLIVAAREPPLPLLLQNMSDHDNG